MANASFLDYRMPTTLDMPMIETVLVEVPNPRHPFGLRGVGEVPIIPPPGGPRQRHLPGHWGPDDQAAHVPWGHPGGDVGEEGQGREVAPGPPVEPPAGRQERVVSQMWI